MADSLAFASGRHRCGLVLRNMLAAVGLAVVACGAPAAPKPIDVRYESTDGGAQWDIETAHNDSVEKGYKYFARIYELLYRVSHPDSAVGIRQKAAPEDGSQWGFP